MRYPILYDEAWRIVRANLKGHRALSDELLWHKVYEFYIDLASERYPATLEAIKGLGKAERRDVLVEAHLGILRPIAARLAYKRAPRSFGIWSKEANAQPHVSLIHELAAFGALGLFIAAERFEPERGRAFSTYANYWAKKLMCLYLEEIIGNVPRTGDMGDDMPRRSVMDIADAALNRVRLYRGKAAGGMALFDSSLTISGPNPGDKEIEIVSSDGQTSPDRLDYLQRHVGKKLYPWVDIGSGFGPRFELKGHAGGKASDGPPESRSATYELDDSLPLPPVPVSYNHTGPQMLLGVTPAEICYLDKRCGSYNSYDNFGKPRFTPPKELIVPNVGHWSNSIPFAVDYLRRCGRKLWRKPTYYEELRDARHDRKNGLLYAA